MIAPMTRSQMVDLLSLIAAYDQRTVGHTDVDAWFLVATTERWTSPLAQRAVVDFHRRSAERGRIRPAHITDAIEQARQAVRRIVLHRPLDPPRDLADDPRAEIEWRRQRMDELTDEALAAWCRGEPVEAYAPPAIDGPRDDHERLAAEKVRGQAKALANRKRVAPASTGAQDAPDPTRRAAEREKARAELAAIAPASAPSDDLAGEVR